MIILALFYYPSLYYNVYKDKQYSESEYRIDVAVIESIADIVRLNAESRNME